MDSNEIIKNFQIDRKNKDINLVTQLRTQVSRFIQSNSAGTKLPPEREMAKVLGISRVTARGALDYFFEHGMIVRKGRRGTFTAGASGGINSLLHPMLLDGGMMGISPITLQMATFEITPRQRAFWKKAFDMFNARHPEIHIESVDIPRSVSAHNYADYIVNTGPDIFLSSASFTLGDVSASLPESLRKKMLSEEFSYRDNPGMSSALGNVFPMKSTSLVFAWNRDLAKQIGVENVAERFKQGKRLELFAEAAKKLPPGFNASGHIWDSFVLMGMPRNGELFSKKFLMERLRRFEKFSGTANMFITEQEYGLEAMDRFTAGKQLFFEGLGNYLFYSCERHNFDAGILLFTPEKNCSLCRDAVNIKVYKNSANKKSAFKFLDFLLSKEIQDMIVADLLSTSFRKDSNLAFKSVLDHTSKREIDCYLERSPGIAAMSEDLFKLERWFLIYKIRDVLHALMNGKQDSEQAAGIIIKRWRIFQAAPVVE